MMRWLAACLALSAALFVSDARASVSIAVTWDGLLRESSAAALVTALDARALWEGDRIYTYTHVRVDRAVAGELATGDEAWVRTMGGVVGKIGQIVDGEPVLTRGQSCLLFLHPIPSRPPGAFDVTARGQGQFPLVSDEKTPPHLVRGTAAGAFLPPRASGSAPPARLAADVVHGRAIDDVSKDVVAAWSAAHAH
ncbi:MAG TPA: hypothetical protein VGL81_30720 [Polyangiaceae bacterium]|jgi:hypothetical protein